MRTKRFPLIIAVLLAIAGLVYFVSVTLSRRQRIEKYNRAYNAIKVGDSRSLVVSTMGEPQSVTKCEYTPFSDEKAEDEFREKCVEQYKYIVLMKDYIISFDTHGAVVGKSTAVSP
jgi:hypothetical protein